MVVLEERWLLEAGGGRRLCRPETDEAEDAVEPRAQKFHLPPKLDRSGRPGNHDQMSRDDAAKGVRVRFEGGEIGLLGELGRSLKGKTGTIVYGISEDIFCYPDNPEMDMVWVAFDEDRLPMRQVSLAFLQTACL